MATKTAKKRGSAIIVLAVCAALATSQSATAQSGTAKAPLIANAPSGVPAWIVGLDASWAEE